MLILNRMEGESIVIDGGIKVKVLAVERGVVRLGIDAPKDVVILREEVRDFRKNSDNAAGQHADSK